MIHINYRLKESGLHGIGLFANQDIKKGELIYTASPLLDVNINQEQFDSLNDSEKKEIKYWGFYDIPSKKWHVDFDVSKFINHLEIGSVTQDPNHTEAYLVAAKDISSGEELTQNYLEFESPEEFASRGISL